MKIDPNTTELPNEGAFTLLRRIVEAAEAWDRKPTVGTRVALSEALIDARKLVFPDAVLETCAVCGWTDRVLDGHDCDPARLGRLSLINPLGHSPETLAEASRLLWGTDRSRWKP